MKSLALGHLLQILAILDICITTGAHSYRKEPCIGPAVLTGAKRETWTMMARHLLSKQTTSIPTADEYCLLQLPSFE